MTSKLAFDVTRVVKTKNALTDSQTASINGTQTGPQRRHVTVESHIHTTHPGTLKLLWIPESLHNLVHLFTSGCIPVRMFAGSCQPRVPAMLNFGPFILVVVDRRFMKDGFLGIWQHRCRISFRRHLSPARL